MDTIGTFGDWLAWQLDIAPAEFREGTHRMGMTVWLPCFFAWLTAAGKDSIKGLQVFMGLAGFCIAVFIPLEWAANFSGGVGATLIIFSLAAAIGLPAGIAYYLDLNNGQARFFVPSIYVVEFIVAAINVSTISAKAALAVVLIIGGILTYIINKYGED